MRRIILMTAFVVGLIAPASAQKAEIEAVNAKWIEFFRPAISLALHRSTPLMRPALPQGSAMVQGGAAIGAMFKRMAERVGDPKLTTLDVKSLGPNTAREIGTFSFKTKAPSPQEVTGKYVVVWGKVGNDWKLASDIWNENE